MGLTDTEKQQIQRILNRYGIRSTLPVNQDTTMDEESSVNAMPFCVITDRHGNFYMDVAAPEPKQDVAPPEPKQDEAVMAREAYIQRLKNPKKKSSTAATMDALPTELSPEQAREKYIQRLQRKKSYRAT